MTPRQRYRLLRWVLVQCRRAAFRWHINFPNAVESSAKDCAWMQRDRSAPAAVPVDEQIERARASDDDDRDGMVCT